MVKQWRPPAVPTNLVLSTKYAVLSFDLYLQTLNPFPRISPMTSRITSDSSRRDFLQATGAVVAASAFAGMTVPHVLSLIHI